jgi:hypothetical protein
MVDVAHLLVSEVRCVGSRTGFVSDHLQRRHHPAKDKKYCDVIERCAEMLEGCGDEDRGQTLARRLGLGVRPTPNMRSSLTILNLCFKSYPFFLVIFTGGTSLKIERARGSSCVRDAVPIRYPSSHLVTTFHSLIRPANGLDNPGLRRRSCLSHCYSSSARHLVSLSPYTHIFHKKSSSGISLK